MAWVASAYSIEEAKFYHYFCGAQRARRVVRGKSAPAKLSSGCSQENEQTQRDCRAAEIGHDTKDIFK
jgi:hypothetical protein